MHALTFRTFGGPEVLEYATVADPRPEPGSLLVETKAIGLNFADLYRRRGIWQPRGEAPYVNGFEGAGLVADANGVPGFSAGDRVAFADVPFANAELVAVPAGHAIRLPDDVTFPAAASLLLQGLTAQYLAWDSHRTRPGETALVHAAAGGVGQLLSQVLRIHGARVIGLTSSEEKRALARENGAEEVLLYDAPWVERVRALTGGAGADVVFDSVGTTIHDSLAAARAGGHVVFFGRAGGPPPPIDPMALMEGSRTITGGDLWHFLDSGEERNRRAAELFGWMRSGRLRVAEAACFPLSEGRRAHELMESRRSAGKILLIP